MKTVLKAVWLKMVRKIKHISYATLKKWIQKKINKLLRFYRKLKKKKIFNIGKNIILIVLGLAVGIELSQSSNDGVSDDESSDVNVVDSSDDAKHIKKKLKITTSETNTSSASVPVNITSEHDGNVNDEEEKALGNDLIPAQDYLLLRESFKLGNHPALFRDIAKAMYLLLDKEEFQLRPGCHLGGAARLRGSTFITCTEIVSTKIGITLDFNLDIIPELHKYNPNLDPEDPKLKCIFNEVIVQTALIGSYPYKILSDNNKLGGFNKYAREAIKDEAENW